ncbi:MAG: YtxH domain-containing protein [Cyclobacteriaceae bacterium]|nr:YtxH domain-containing protein [Cyclobacteriaceae bacterium]
MNSIKVLAGMVAGIAIGAVLGVLTAPESGNKTRKKLDQEMSKLRGNFNKAMKESLDTFKSYIQQTSSEISADMKGKKLHEGQTVKENKAESSF